MPDASYREMERWDLPVLLEMSRENMAPIILSSWGVDLRDEEILRAILEPSSYTEVAESEGEIIGYYSVEMGEGRAFINSIQVKRGYQNRGLGRAMMERIERRARSAGIGIIDLWVQLTNRQAKEFYRHRGYRTMSRQGNNYLMRKQLF